MNELSELFKLVAEEKKKKKEEIDSLIGDSFDKLFVEQLKPNKSKGNIKKSLATLEKELQSLDNISYSSIDKLMGGICSEYDVTPEELHNAFKKKHKMIPDEWIKNQKEEKISEEVVIQTPKKLINEGLLNIPPETRTKDPLTPLNQNYATLDDLQKHYKIFLDRIQRQLSTLGGGGETNLTYMDVPVTSVTTSSYTIRPQDYYIGVNYAGAVTITLPRADREGKIFVVKDELGEASRGTNRYITVLPTGSDLIDGRDRAILAYDYGSLTFIWKDNSWRII
jgi:hypothetical protein